jgi:hypothetical protein
MLFLQFEIENNAENELMTICRKWEEEEFFEILGKISYQKFKQKHL